MGKKKGGPVSVESLRAKSAKKKEQRHRREAAARQSQVKLCKLAFLSPSLHIAYLILYFSLQSSTPSTPSSSFASPATSAPRTTGPARDAGFDALLQAAGGDDDDDDDPFDSADIVSNLDSGLALLIAAAAVAPLGSPVAGAVTMYRRQVLPFQLRCSFGVHDFVSPISSPSIL